MAINNNRRASFARTTWPGAFRIFQRTGADPTHFILELTRKHGRHARCGEHLAALRALKTWA